MPKVLYDISVLGAGYTDPRARTGVFRVVENIANGLLLSEEVNLTFCATNSLKMASQARNYLAASDRFSEIAFDAPSWQQDLSIKLTDSVERLSQQERVSVPQKIMRRSLLAAINMLERNTKLISHSGFDNSELFHSPFYPIPNYIQSNQKLKKIITVYDLIPILYPEFFKFDRDHTVKKALENLNSDNWITCISHATKNDLCNYLNKQIDPDRVVVTYLAASDLFYPCTDRAELASVREKYHIPNTPYILSLSTLEPRKNIEHTIRCFAKLVEQENIQDLHFVLVGTKGWDFDKIFHELSNNAIKNRITITGYVADEDLAALYSGALAFIYPSFYEGFGLPPLEAMQCGIPVITANTSSLPEVVGDAGITISPTDGDALCQSILDLYGGAELRSQLSSKSIEQAKKFSWQKCTEQTIDTYRLALNS